MYFHDSKLSHQSKKLIFIETTTSLATVMNALQPDLILTGKRTFQYKSFCESFIV